MVTTPKPTTPGGNGEWAGTDGGDFDVDEKKIPSRKNKDLYCYRRPTALATTLLQGTRRPMALTTMLLSGARRPMALATALLQGTRRPMALTTMLLRGARSPKALTTALLHDARSPTMLSTTPLHGRSTTPSSSKRSMGWEEQTKKSMY
jgi:hypothetical protein